MEEIMPMNSVASRIWLTSNEPQQKCIHYNIVYTDKFQTFHKTKYGQNTIVSPLKAWMSSYIPCLMALKVWMYSRLSQVVLSLFITLLFSLSIFVLVNNLSGLSPWCQPATRRAVSCKTFVMVSAAASRSSCGISSSMLNLFHNSASNLTWCFFSLLVSIS